MKIKDFLLEDSQRVVTLLENLGCHCIKARSGYITCARPTGDNPVGISVKLDSRLNTKVNTRKTKVKDVIDLVAYIQETDLSYAFKYIKDLFELGKDFDYHKTEQLISSLNIFKNQTNNDEFIRTYLDEEYLKKYKQYVVKEWIDEGINPSIQRKYDVRIDTRGQRWIIPIRDENGNLVSVKGRTYRDDAKVLKIAKYIYYTKLGYNDILFGLDKNKENIKDKKEVIIFESEKSVMKAESFGFNNCIAVGMGCINDRTKKKLLQLNCSIVLAFDKGIQKKDILEEARKFNMFCDVYIIDSNNSKKLEDKDAPVDKGLDVFLDLYNKRKKVC